MSENPLSKASKKEIVFLSKNGVGRFFLLGFFFPPFFSTMACNTLSFASFHYFSKYREAVYHSLHDPCLPLLLKSCYRGSCYLTNLFFFSLLAKVPLLGPLFLFEAAIIITTTTPTYLLTLSKLQNTKWVCFLVMCHNMDHGLFSAGPQESQVHLIVLVPPLSSPTPPPQPNFIDLSLII